MRPMSESTKRFTGVDSTRVRVFLADSLALWRVAGSVESGDTPDVTVVRAGQGTTVWVERSREEGIPFRWLVRWRAASDAPGGARERHPRPCTSVVGMLNAVRSALGVDRGAAVRIAPSPDEP